MIKNLKESLVFLLTLILVVNSFTNEINPNDLRNLEKALHKSSEYMSNEVKDEHAAICIGGTRAGKSTLINYLIGNELTAARLFTGQPVTISKVNTDSIGPEIGAGTTSKTTIPTRWISTNLPDLALWDAPGFDDNRGSVQDITNAFYLYQLLHNVKSLKFVLVIDINDILNDNIKPFLSVLSAVESLLKNKMKTSFRSISVVFTKVPDSLDEAEVDKEFIKNKLSYQLLSSTDMFVSDASKNFVQFLTQNTDHIAFFKRAKPGPVTSDLDVDIFSTIQNSESIEKVTLKDVSPSISDSSKLFLFEAREKLLSMRAFSDLEKVVADVCNKTSNALEMANNENKENNIRKLYSQLSAIHNHIFRALVDNTDFYEKMVILKEIDNAISKSIEDNGLLEKIKLMDFVDKLLELEESKQISYQLQAVLLSAASRVKEVITSAQLKLGEISQKKYDEVIKQERENHKRQMNDLRRKLQAAIEKNKKRKGAFRKLCKHRLVLRIPGTWGGQMPGQAMPGQVMPGQAGWPPGAPMF